MASCEVLVMSSFSSVAAPTTVIARGTSTIDSLRRRAVTRMSACWTASESPGPGLIAVFGLVCGSLPCVPGEVAVGAAAVEACASAAPGVAATAPINALVVSNIVRSGVMVISPFQKPSGLACGGDASAVCRCAPVMRR
ncbi:hypothetical protein [Sphingomonas sp.]|uniref:hypothetical protein n=1 Tax=Sphingomonas sp. TaxID=28214 RepID=UPI002ED7CD8B